MKYYNTVSYLQFRSFLLRFRQLINHHAQGFEVVAVHGDCCCRILPCCELITEREYLIFHCDDCIIVMEIRLAVMVIHLFGKCQVFREIFRDFRMLHVLLLQSATKTKGLQSSGIEIPSSEGKDTQGYL